MNKVILLDRDGVINQDSLHYIKSAEEFIFLPGSLAAIARLTEAGYRIGVATNQSGVSRGYYSEIELAAIHQKLMDEVRAAGGDIAAIEYCIHMPNDGCSCRKPQPGMLRALAQRLHCSLTNIPFIGDRVSDIQAAEAVGARPMMVLSPMTDRVGLQSYPHVPVFSSLTDCVNFLLTEHEE
ncbi:D-glycero-beta-D-manno-heptose 1,7-bisphosphate 7-phosphatase [Legionella jamestowniensis]|uniref:D,D-heptose 1,7-bisphosphate phosphatase n=1 Tax=Legionella jamestowniensis TaxID=455 RepID=A0A0W0UL62_9GAMM|nr:D-glycero-beta-D-manno-heptose 1,7-bisphosphate 7-phosphatase [Legionella jamestowniensis]KTD08632.1 D,D-heptose 1,7-bisphosphate phosphatase [Legionella jamestowniensis]OCH96921.1 D-glycero-beta-D-manno-heptose-1,7-bisphosphate 7-phosphatase [Legionella jamestowniensis]SFL53865.1 D-glycero-D-manno-heptose 1,7-bisphosphate phosphatase [Legionella jamestowniensis DSM 19215]